MRPSSPFLATLWKFASMVVIVMMTFGTPLSDTLSYLPLLPQVPVAQAEEITAPEDISSVECSPVVSPGLSGNPLLGICTDVGVYQRTIGTIKNKISHQLVMAGISSLFSSLSYFTQTIAYD